MKTKPTKVWRTILVVEGSGEFPFDMLRYDSCCPDTEDESHKLDRGQRRQVKLRRFSVNALGATARRWESFGWRVVSEEPVI